MRRHRSTATTTGILIAALVGGLLGGGCMLPPLERPADALGDARGTADATGGGGTDGNGSVADSGTSASDADGGSGGPPFSEVKTLMVDNCADCHVPGGTGAVSNFTFSSKSPSDSAFRQALQGTAEKPSGMQLLKPGEPAKSAIYVRTQPGGMEDEMPSAGGWKGDPAASEATLENWIAAGAKMPGSPDQ